MDPADKKFIRAIIRRVHPDLFGDSPFERQSNSESLMARAPPQARRRRFPLERITDAFRALLAREVQGKCLLLVAPGAKL